MTTHTVRPGSLIDNSGGHYAGQPVNTITANLKDDDDTTIVVGTAAAFLTEAFDGYTLSANERCAAARARFRASPPFGGGAVGVTWGIGNFSGYGGNPGAWTPDEAAVVGGLGTYTGAWRDTAPVSGGEWKQQDLNNLHMHVLSLTDGSTHTTCYWTELYIDLDIRTQPSVTMAAPTGTTTHWPTISFTPTYHDSDTQSKFRIRIFDTSINATPSWTDTTGLVYDHTGTTPTSHQVQTALADGNYKAFVAVATNFRSTDWYSDVASHTFTLASALAVPTSVAAVASTLVSNTPTVQAHVVGPTSGTLKLTAKAEFEMATDSGFTTNLKDFVALDLWLTYNGTVEATVPSDQALSQGVWYLRARTYDKLGSVSAWSAAITVTVAHPPSTLDYTPTGGNSITFAASIPFAWTFYDTSSDDTQTAYQIVIVDSSGNTVVDTGKSPNDAQGALVAIPATYKDTQLRWKLQVWDVDDVASGFSPYQAFVMSDVPGISISAPTDGGTVSSPAPEVDWVFSATGSRTQAAWRVQVSQINEDGSTTSVYDTDWVNGDDQTHNLTTPAMIVNGGTYTITVFVRDSTRLENSTNVTVTTSWVAPLAPVTTVDTSKYDDQGYVLVSWDNSNEDTDWYAWRVYRRRDDEITYQLLLETTDDLTSFTYMDFLAPSNTDSDWVVVQVALRFGSAVESDRFSNEVLATPPGTKYWIISDDDKQESVRLDICTSDEPTDEYESAEMLIYGRGRKIDQGTRWGFRGELVARLLDNERATARVARQSINNLRFSQSAVYVRTPFGDVIHSQLGDVKFSRDAGMGLMESGSITIPYAEIYE